MSSKLVKIAVTGGPGGGKTTALDLFQREYGDKLSVVPEAASLLFKGGMRRESEPSRVMSLQKAIYQTQVNLEEAFASLCRGQFMLCDRGTLDGLAYWSAGEENFYQTLNTSFEKEIARYDAVIFFETSAASGDAIKSNNPYRTEDANAATRLDKRLQEIWSKHPRYHFVPHQQSFMKKIATGIVTIDRALLELCQTKNRG